MKPIDVGKIKVAPFEIERILEFRIEKELNEHARLYVKGVVKDDKQNTPVMSMSESTAIKFENDGQVYFAGVLQNVKITCVEAVYYLEVYAVSSTILLDTTKQRRSFQDNGQSYSSIVQTVTSEKSASVAFNAPGKTVENIILQYDETDWAFARRLASHTNSVLIPDSTSASPKFDFGVGGGGGGSIESNNYSISKDFDAIRRMSGEENKLTEDGAVLYTVESDEFKYQLGESLSLNGEALYICRITVGIEKSALVCVYTLCPKAAVAAPKYYNRAMTGLVLDGKVLKMEKDKVKLHLSIDDAQDEGKAHLFSYATGYSAEGHTGWYVMPEEGDTVSLLFPKEDEKYAYACASVRQADTDKTADHLVKYLRTPFGKEIKLEEKEILITGKDDDTFIRINEDSGIEIITSKPIQVTSRDTIDIYSEGDMSIGTGKNLSVLAEDSITLTCSKNVIEITPKSGISISTDKKLEARSEDNAIVSTKKEMELVSGKDMKIDSGGKLAGAAKSAMELSCSGSSVIMKSSGVDIKGTMIKEN